MRSDYPEIIGIAITSILFPNSEIDYSVETVDGRRVKKNKVNRPKTLCLDYLILKDAFGIDPETEVEDNIEAQKSLIIWIIGIYLLPLY